MSFIDGLVTGLDTTSIINQLMQIERRPQVMLTTRRDQQEAARTELSELRTDVNALRTLAADLRLASGWDRVTASSSDEDAVSVQATSASSTGSYSFQVTSLATAASVYSTTEYASAETVVTAPGASVFQVSGYQSLGFSSVVGADFDIGSVAFSVVQASTKAEIKGSGIPTIPITVDGTNDSIDFAVNGLSFTVTMAHGTYTDETAIAAAVSAAIDADASAEQVVTATLNSSNGITLATKAEGSDHGIIITGGTALGDLGLTVGASAFGTDGIVEVDGVQTVITDASADVAVTLTSAGAGTIDAVLSGPIRMGTATAEQVTAGDGSLTDLVSTINSSKNLGYTALAVDTGSGFRLQLIANETGADSAISIDTGLYGAMAFTTLSTGTDAQLTIQGDNPFTIASSTNTFDSLLPGVSVTAKAVTATPVTISTERDVEAVTESVDGLVTKLNEILSRIADGTSNEPGTASVLQGNTSARRVADWLRNAVIAPVDTTSLTSVGMAGIELTSDGKLTFNKDKFSEALLSDSSTLTALFIDRDGTGDLGVLDRLIDAADGAASYGDGVLYTAAESAERRVDDYAKQIDAIQERLEIRESTLRRTFANLEVALSGLQNQSAYLAAQLSSLGGT